MPTPSRIEYLDLAKGLCLILVAAVHIVYSYKTQVPMNHVVRAIYLTPFYFISGYFFKPYNCFTDFLKRKTNKLLIPFIFWFLFISVFLAYIYGQLGLTVFSGRPISLFSSVIKFFHGESFINVPIWFLLCLFETNIIFYLLHALVYKLFKRRQTLVICILSLLLGIVGIKFINMPFYLGKALEIAPFFAFGYVCRHHTKLLEPNKFDKYIPLILIVLGLFLYFLTPRQNIFIPQPIAIHSYLLHYPCGIAGATFIILLSKWIRHLPAVNWWGKNSIILLVLHGPIYLHILDLNRHFHIYSNHPWSASLITLTLTFACCSIAIPICKLLFPHVTAQKDLLPLRNLLPHKKKAISDNKS